MATQYSKTTADPKVILDLKVNAKEAIEAIISAQEQMAKLREEQKQLEAQMKAGNGSKEMAQRLVLIKTEMRDLGTVIRANQKELDNNVKAYKQQGDSINAMRAQLKNMRAEYEDLSKADRDSAFGEKMLTDIKNLTDEIKSLEQAQGDFTRSVGTYGKLFDTTAENMQSFGSVLSSIFGQNSIIGKAATVVTGFGKTLSDTSKKITDMASTAQTSTKSVTELTTAVSSTASSVTDMSKSMDSAATVVQGFGAAERAAADAAKTMATAETAASTATAATAKTTASAATATTGLVGGFKAATTAAKAFGKQLLALLANPIVAIIAAVVVVVLKLADAFKKNDKAMTALQSAMAAFRPILDLINRGFQVLVGVVTKAIDGISRMVQAVTNAIPFLRKYAQQEEDIVRSTDALEDAEREYALNSAKRQSEISELRNKAAESEKYSFEERKKFLEQAMDLEKQDIEEKRANAEESLRIAEQKALNEIGFTEMTAEAWEKLSDEQKNHITELRVNVESLAGEYADATRRMTTQLNSFEKEEKAKQKQRAKTAADAAKERVKNELAAMRELEDAYLKGISDMYLKEEIALRRSSERRIEDLKLRLQTEKNLTKNARKYINEQIILEEANLQIELDNLRIKNDQEIQKKRLESQRQHYQEMLKTLKSDSEVEDAVQIELVELDTKLFINSFEQARDQAKRIVDEIKNDVDNLKDEDIKIKYGFDKAQLQEVLAQRQKELQIAEADLTNMQTLAEKQRQLAITKIQREGMNAREAMAQTHADLLNEIETQKSLELYYYNEVEKSKILEQQSEYRLSVAKKNLEDLKNYTEQEQIAIYGNEEAYQNAVLEAELAVVNAENDLADAVRNTNTAIADQKDRLVETFKTIGSSIDSVLNSFQSIFDSLAESDEKYKKYSTALAMMQILVSTAVSISNAIQGATAAAAATGPGAPIATPIFIAEMVSIVAGAIASSVATLKKAQSSAPAKPKFSTGGPVDRSVSGGMIGTKTTKRKDDTIDAKLSLGEYVIKSEIVKKYGIGFFDELNETRRRKPDLPMRFAGGGTVPSLTTINQMTTAIDYSEMGEVLRDAISDIQPVVSVQEINSMQARVNVKEQTATYN